MIYSDASVANFFFFNYTATTEIYTLSLHDALPIYPGRLPPARGRPDEGDSPARRRRGRHFRGGSVRPHLGNAGRSEEHTSELQSQSNLVCRLLLEKKKERIPQLHYVQHLVAGRDLH